MKDTKLMTVDAYIAAIDEEHRKAFLELHQTILKAAPSAESCMSYGMPAIKSNGIVVYYAHWEKHAAIYPMPSALKAFADQISGFVTSKSTIQFPHGKKIPKKLITDIVKFRLEENFLKRGKKTTKKAQSTSK
jgi:uncharacterized protein YdhG (YjbR/CyaY superfamily)